MHERYAVIAVHGIGSGSESERMGFSENLAKLVYEDRPGDRVRLWHESVWEGENENFDRVMRKIVERLVRKDIFPSVFSMKGLRAKLNCFVAKLACSVVKFKYGDGLVDYSMTVLDALFDFVRYLDSDVGKKIRSRVREDIEHCCMQHQEGVVVLAHSLGSLIAHDVLHEMTQENVAANIKAFITIGSPIEWAFELRDVDNKQEKAWISLGDIPWFNYYYQEDPVSIDGSIDGTIFKGVVNTRLSLPEKFSKLHTSWKAHCAYWEDTVFADKVRSILACSEPVTPAEKNNGRV